MCTVVILRRPGHSWPVIIAANRDEMLARAWEAPARHWPDRVDVIAGRDTLAGGSWLGINDHGLAAAILNRPGSLGPADDKRSRGELVLDALDHAEAGDAAAALAEIDPAAYRTFNLLIADPLAAFWVRHDGERPPAAIPVPDGLSMITAHDLNDPTCPRIGRHRPRFAAAPAPDLDNRDIFAWEALLADTAATGSGEGPESAMRIETDWGFGTVNASIIGLPAPETGAGPRFLFADGPPGERPFEPVSTAPGQSPAPSPTD